MQAMVERAKRKCTSTEVRSPPSSPPQPWSRKGDIPTVRAAFVACAVCGDVR